MIIYGQFIDMDYVTYIILIIIYYLKILNQQDHDLFK